MSSLPFTGFVIPAGGGSSSGGGVSGLDTADGGTALADNVIVRGDGTTGIQGSGVSISDADVVSGATQVNVDNLRIDGNTISSTNTNGDVNVSPDGTGNVVVNGTYLSIGSSAKLRGAAIDVLDVRSNDGSSVYQRWTGTGVNYDDDYPIKFGSTAFGTMDFGLNRSAAGVGIFTDGSTGVGAILTARSVEANTDGSGSPNILTATESNKILTNEGSGATNYHTLPSAAAGLVFTFAQEDSTQLIRVVANTGDIIAGPFSTASAGYYESGAEGSWLTVAAINTDRWQVISIGGVWTDGTSTYDDTGLVA